MKPLDIAFEEFKAREMEAGKHKPYLDKALFEIEKIDEKINWFNEKAKQLEKEKQVKLSNLNELFDLAMVSKHSLKNGFTAKTDNRYKLEVEDTGAFLKWLKANCEPQEILKFFSDSLKVTKLKSFCEAKINEMRINGELAPEIDGVKIYDVTFRRLTTKKEVKK